MQKALFTRICNRSEIQDYELYRFDIGDKALLVMRDGDEFIVTSAICTHEESDLTLGILSDKTITCPLHQAKFDLESGIVLSGPDGDSPDSIPRLKIFETKIENEDLFADL